MNRPSGQGPSKSHFLDKQQQEEQALADETGKVSVYLDLADKALAERTEKKPLAKKQSA